jgi:hypothetical protein
LGSITYAGARGWPIQTRVESAKAMAKTKQTPGNNRSILVVLLAVVAVALTWFIVDLRTASRNKVAVDNSEQQQWTPPQKSDRWKCIVVHHSASEVDAAKSIDEYHRSKGWDELGYHFVIGNGSESADGQIEVGSRWLAQKHGAHCKSDSGYYNEHGIGICLVGNFENHPPTTKQLASLERLVSYLCREFNIDRSEILSHGGVTGKTLCPGKHMDLAAIRGSSLPAAMATHDITGPCEDGPNTYQNAK